jgi:hypothetical protein
VLLKLDDVLDVKEMGSDKSELIMMIISNHSTLSVIEKALQVVMDIVSCHIDEPNRTKQDKETEKS